MSLFLRKQYTSYANKSLIHFGKFGYASASASSTKMTPMYVEKYKAHKLETDKLFRYLSIIIPGGIPNANKLSKICTVPGVVSEKYMHEFEERNNKYKDALKKLEVEQNYRKAAELTCDELQVAGKWQAGKNEQLSRWVCRSCDLEDHVIEMLGRVAEILGYGLSGCTLSGTAVTSASTSTVDEEFDKYLSNVNKKLSEVLVEYDEANQEIMLLNKLVQVVGRDMGCMRDQIRSFQKTGKLATADQEFDKFWGQQYLY